VYVIRLAREAHRNVGRRSIVIVGGACVAHRHPRNATTDVDVAGGIDVAMAQAVRAAPAADADAGRVEPVGERRRPALDRLRRGREMVTSVGEVGAQVLMMSGETAAARDALEQAEHVARRAAGPFTLATVLNVQATLANICGDDDLALDRASMAARAAADADVVWTLVYSLPILAAQAARRDHCELAVALFAASELTAESSPRRDRELPSPWCPLSHRAHFAPPIRGQIRGRSFRRSEGATMFRASDQLLYCGPPGTRTQNQRIKSRSGGVLPPVAE